MKRKDLYTFRSGLKSANFQHPRCTYAVNKNKRLVQQAIEDMEKTIKPDEEMEKFFKEREELARKHATKNEAGEPKLTRMSSLDPDDIKMTYVIPGIDDKESKYRKELDKIEKKYKESIEKHDEKIKKYNEEFINDESDFEPFMIELSVLETHEKIPQHVMDRIFFMIKE